MSAIRQYVEAEARVIIDYFVYDVSVTSFTKLGLVTAMRLGRFLATDKGKLTLEEDGYVSGHTIIVADGYGGVDEIKQRLKVLGGPGYVAFSEGSRLFIGVIDNSNSELIPIESKSCGNCLERGSLG